MNKQNAVQELKAERVQEEIALAAEEAFQISLKAERVQEPSLAAIGKVPLTSALELTINQRQPVTIELQALQTVITLHGMPAAADGPAR